MFLKILIANRGEIAVRVIRACRELGLASVAVFSEPDRHALHVRLADESVAIGPAPARESYLNGERILEAAAATGAEAIHPGYGFLSENAAFARAVAEAGLVFIGPPPDAIAAMGDKAAARERMQAAGVPVVPGWQGQDDDATLRFKAAQVGFPVIVKAAAGGGGKGMRVVERPGDLDEAAGAARREARAAFGDDRLILERYVPHAHHVEFQVLADAHGNVLHLFERECSIQRRHQKIIEETPSPLLDRELRARMGEAAVAAAHAAGYRNAGTVEFIVDPETRQFYFLEMNTRLQVEHPITEMVVGVDLAQWQIRIAAGERLPFRQEDLVQRGHAIECRLYAEDPADRFLPAAGRLLRFIEPEGPGVRVDTGVTTGDEISVHYDPMIAKLIVHAESRPAAIRKMLAALADTVLLGITTNWQFLQDVLGHPDFQAGRTHTTWIDEEYTAWQAPQCEIPPEVLAAAALADSLREGSQWIQATGSPSMPGGDGGPAGRHGSPSDPLSPWGAGGGFRVGE
jgi:acetyl-CoA carboxylase biotin carboxylase subunit